MKFYENRFNVTTVECESMRLSMVTSAGRFDHGGIDCYLGYNANTLPTPALLPRDVRYRP